jgi:hypothetical protein
MMLNDPVEWVVTVAYTRDDDSIAFETLATKLPPLDLVSALKAEKQKHVALIAAWVRSDLQ